MPTDTEVSIIMRKTLKILKYTGTGILLLLLMLFALVSTGALNPLIKRSIVAVANQQINGVVSIGKLQGNLLSEFSIDSLQVRDGERALMKLGSFKLKYRLHDLIFHTITLDSLILDTPEFYLSEEADSMWNFQKLLLAQDSSVTDTFSFLWKINLKHFVIRDLNAEVQTLDSTLMIPQNVSANLHINIEYAQDRLLLQVQQANLKTAHPYFYIEDLKLKAQMEEAVLVWRDFELRLAQSQLTSSGILPLSSPEHAVFSLNASPLDLSDFKPWLSGVYGRADLDVSLENTGDSSLLNLNVNQQSQHLALSATMWDYATLPQYVMSINLDSLDLAYWTQQPDLKSAMNGIINLKGKGFDLEQNALSLDVQLSDISYDEKEVHALSIELNKEQDRINSHINGHTAFGDIGADIQLSRVFEVPTYDLSLHLNNLNLATIVADSSLVSDLNLHLQAQGTGIEWGKMTSSITLQTDKSMLFAQPFSEMTATIHLSEAAYELAGLHLKTPYLDANMAGRGNFSTKNNLKFNIQLQNVEPVLTTLGQEGISFNGGVSGAINGPMEALDFNADFFISKMVMDSLQIINMQTHIQSFFSYGVVTTDTKSKSSINQISFITLENFSVSISSLIDQITYQTHVLNNVELALDKDQETVSGKVLVHANSGSLESNFDIQNAFSVPEYVLQASLRHFDLAKFIQDDSLHTSINLDLSARGKGISKDSLGVELEIQSKNSQAFGHPIDNIDSKIMYKNGYYLIDNLAVKSSFLDAEINGEGNISTHNKLNFNVNVKDIEKLRFNVIPEDVTFSGQVKGYLSGTADSLDFSSHIDLKEVQYAAFTSAHLQTDAQLELRDSAYSGFLTMNLLESKVQDLTFDTIQFMSDFTPEKAHNSFTYYSSDSLNGSFYSTLVLGAVPTLYLNEIVLNFEHDSWLGGSDSSYIRFGHDSIAINAIQVTSNEGSVTADGIFAFDGEESLEIDVQALDVRSIPGIQLSPIAIAGRLDAGLSIVGSAESPEIDAFVHLNDPKVDTLKFKRLGFKLSYGNDSVTLESFVDEQKSQLMHAAITFSYHLAFNDTLASPADDTPLKASLSLDRFDLARLNPFLPLADAHAKGFFDAKINLGNTLNQPSINGVLKLSDGSFEYQPMGVMYNGITLDSRITNNQFLLDSLTLLSVKGKLQLKGLVAMGSLTEGEIKNMDLNIRARNFKLFDSEMATAFINTDLEFSGSADDSHFKGDLSVLKSTFNVDLLMKEFMRVYDKSEKPMLVLARDRNQQTTNQPESPRDTTQTAKPDIYKNLKGSFDIEFPRNTWIKGKNMNFELFGNIKAIKEGEQIDLFGTLDVKRGYYKLYGRQLDFEDGEVIFTGGSSINPKVNFNIAYSFRDPENALRKLNIMISDRITQPTIVFYIDDVAIEEKEAISFLLFNKGLDQLDTKENSTLLDSPIDLIANQISGVVGDVLQSKLDLDVFKISGNEGWTQSTVSTGKYLTNKLYLNYERTFAMDKKDEVIQPQKMTLEYQIYRSLFIQATNQSTNSGFDFILKWSKK